MGPVLVSGVIVGFLYALMGGGLVLLYRQSGVLNFAHGAIGTLAAYVAYVCINHGTSYWLGVLAALGVGIGLSASLELVVVRRLATASDFTIAIATLGVALMIIGFVTMHWGSTPVALREPIHTKWSLHIGSTAVGANQLLAIGITLTAFVALYLMIERTRFGLAMRAASEGPVTAGMLGINVPRIRVVSWIIAGALSAIAALLIVPQYYLDPQFLTAFMITAFAGIVLGGLESIGGALAGGLVFGVGSALLSYYVTDRLTETVSLALILIVLAFFPQGLFGRRLQRVVEPVVRRSASRRPRLSLPSLRVAVLSVGSSPAVRYAAGMLIAAGVVALFIAPKMFSSTTIFELASVGAIFPAVLGQNLISGYGGQSSIGQSGFMVVGAYVAAVLLHRYNLPFWLVVIAALAASAIVGVLLALSATRLSGVYLALVTLSFALALPELASFPTHLTGGAIGIALAPPSLFGLTLSSANQQYTFVMVVALAVAAVFLIASRTAPGRAWRAVRDSEAGAASIGIPVGRVKVRVVAIGGALAALGGILSAVIVGYLAPDSFTLWTSVYLLAAMIVGGSSSVLGSALGAAFIILIPAHTASLPQIPQIVFGAAIVGAVTFAPRGLARVVQLPTKQPVAEQPKSAVSHALVANGGDVVGR